MGPTLTVDEGLHHFDPRRCSASARRLGDPAAVCLRLFILAMLQRVSEPREAGRASVWRIARLSSSNDAPITPASTRHPHFLDSA